MAGPRRSYRLASPTDDVLRPAGSIRWNPVEVGQVWWTAARSGGQQPDPMQGGSLEQVDLGDSRAGRSRYNSLHLPLPLSTPVHLSHSGGGTLEQVDLGDATTGAWREVGGVHRGS
jgi:hypothetical protein